MQDEGMQTWKSSSASSALWALTSCRDLHSACFSALTSTCTASAPASTQLTSSLASALICSTRTSARAQGERKIDIPAHQMMSCMLQDCVASKGINLRAMVHLWGRKGPPACWPGHS